MRKRKGFFALGLVLSFWALSLMNFSMPATAAYSMLLKQVKLPAGTPVVLRIEKSIDSNMAKTGDLVNFAVARDVEIDGKVVIKQGSIATGEVVKAEKPGIIGAPGKLLVALRSVKTVDGKEVPLRATIDEEGKDKQILAIIIGVVLCILGLFLIKGDPAIIPAGTEVKAYTDVDVNVEVG